ncbi:bacitracin ABC transporter ATP-binding protein [Chryseomicrobium excrementi]|uniref:Bacitracin ABC transporter ATP-binding protein n=1 Tax=Chryseomicrobium excrementi TaxID=2041346 RepID=A0A2M9EZ00_9BACL|nr:ABC transporter ATP-binding protein [Chryseomicrobium excrementi]PJK16425.1 bacitracin ABC transporter ATP-binding protein [Chryseomicrobium excrementi]
MELVNLKKTIRKKEIIKGISFQIQRGEVFGFLGPNGAGKTTTIRMMVGLMGITDGDVLIEGKSIRNEFKQAVRHVGAIVENPEMYPFLSGWKNLQQYARMMEGITEERIREVVALVGLEKAIHEKAGRYSLGMRQRLGIAQALLHNPSILILDEPTNGLDPSGIREIRLYLRKLAEEENVAVIVSSHLLSEIELMCDRIGIIKNGKLIAIEQVKKTTVEDEALIVQLEAEPVNGALQIVKSHILGDVVVEGNLLTFSTNRDALPAIIKALAMKDVAVYGLHHQRATLEDKFFDLIGENVIG